MSEVHSFSENGRGDALFGWSNDFLVGRFAQHLEEREDWDPSISIDTALVQRELTCVDFQPRNSGVLANPLSRSLLFHSLVGELYLSATQAEIDLLKKPAGAVKTLLLETPLSAEATFYLEVESILTGAKPLQVTISRVLRRLAEGLEFFQVITNTRLTPPCCSGDGKWSITSGETGVFRGITHESGDFVVPGDALVFTQNSRPIRLGSRDDHVPVIKRLLEADVLVAVGKHFLETGVPPESIVVVNISTGEAEQRVLNPSTFVRSLELISSGFANATRRKIGEQVPRTGGMWCGACELRPQCAVSQQQGDR